MFLAYERMQNIHLSALLTFSKLLNAFKSSFDALTAADIVDKAPGIDLAMKHKQNFQQIDSYKIHK